MQCNKINSTTDGVLVIFMLSSLHKKRSFKEESHCFFCDNIFGLKDLVYACRLWVKLLEHNFVLRLLSLLSTKL